MESLTTYCFKRPWIKQEEDDSVSPVMKEKLDGAMLMLAAAKNEAGEPISRPVPYITWSKKGWVNIGVALQN